MKFQQKTKLMVMFLMTILSTTTFAQAYKNKPCRYKDDALMMTSCSTPTLNDGVYVGGQVGYNSYWVRENINLPAPSDISGNPKINAPGWVLGLLFGYGYYFDNTYYLGGEIFGNYDQANESYILNDSLGSYSSKFSTYSNWGASLLPGIKISSNYLTYIRLGWSWANLKSNESAAGTSFSKSNTSNGIQYGLGMEALLVDDWSIRGEYTHINYSSFTSGFGTNFDPSDNQVMLGLIYHLGGGSSY